MNDSNESPAPGGGSPGSGANRECSAGGLNNRISKPSAGNTQAPIDFAALMPEVARRLLGEPNNHLSKPPRDMRYGTHGSMSVNCEAGEFFDHEANVGGGVLDLIGHKLGLGHAEAMQWLRSEGLLSERPKPRKPEQLGVVSKIVDEYFYCDEVGQPLFQVVRFEPKGFRQRRPDGNGGWIWGLGKETRRVLYRLPQVLAAINENKTIYVVEGEKDVHALEAAGMVATCNAGGAGKWRDEYTEFLRGANVIVIPDNDKPGRDHANLVERKLYDIVGEVVVLELDVGEKGDISDWLAAGNMIPGKGEVVDWLAAGGNIGTRAVDEESTKPLGDAEIEARVAQLAALSEIAYQKKRKDEAKALGVAQSVLDKLVKGKRSEVADEESALPHWNVEPWPGDVSGAEVLDGLKATFQKFIWLPKGAADALALWVLHAWTIDAAEVSPFMVLVSPTKRCGKTSVMILLLYLTPRSELASNISPSALFRYIEDVRPTLLIDEADSFVKDNEEMRGILNSGHTRAAAHVIRNVEVNGEHKAKRFSTWAPKAIATIRSLADTLEDRAIVVQLQRKPKTATVARLLKRDCAEFETLRRKAARWAEVNFDALAADPDPATPDELNDRAADNWRQLLAIADLAGGEWPRRARQAARDISGEGHEAGSINVDLLADIHKAFGDKEAMRSVDLVQALNEDQERPWCEWSHGKPLTQKQLGGLLRPFCISSETVSVDGLKDAKGYKRTRFEEAWASYLPTQKPGSNSPTPSFQASEASKRRNADGMGTSSTFRSVAPKSGDGSKNANLSYSHAGSDASTLRGAENGSEPKSPKRVCDHCRRPGTDADRLLEVSDAGEERHLHDGCIAPWAGAGIPDILRRA